MSCPGRVTFLAAVAVAALSLLAAGCGGSSPRVANVGTTTVAATTAPATTVEDGDLAGAVAFARCMRSHGIPGWPDPMSSGVFDKSELRQIGVSPARVRAIEESACNYVFENGPSHVIAPGDQAYYVRAAACMRSHGVPGFPGPTFQNDNVSFTIPPGTDTSSGRFKTARSVCEKLIPPGLPYSSPADTP
jgi:hypothetical protein